MQNLITPTEYARLRGTSHTSVQRAIKDGRLVKSLVRDERGKIKVNPVAANLEWKLNTNEKYLPKSLRGEEPEAVLDKVTKEGETATPITGSQWRLVQEGLRAKMLKMQLNEKEGKLLDADAVKKEAFRQARMVRDALMNIPDRISGVLAGVSDAAEIHKKISDEIRKALQELPQ